MATMPILDTLSLVGALAALLSLILKPRAFWAEPQDKFVLVYAIAIIISNPMRGWVGGGIVALTNFAPVLFCYFLIRMGVQSYTQLRRFIRLFILLNLFLTTNGLMQVYLGAGFGDLEAMDTREGARIMGTGIFNDPNDLGMTLVMSVPFVLGSALGRGTRFFVRLFSLTALVAILLACFYTNSRGTMLGLGIVFAMFVYRRFGVTAAVTCGAIGLVGLLAFGPSRMSTLSSEEASAQGRIQAWSDGLQMFKSSPIRGIGYRRFGDVHGMVAHNAFVHVLGELGITGALPFVGLFYSFFRGMNREPTPEAAANPLQLQLRNEIGDSMLGMLTCIMFLSRQYVVVPFVLIGLGACYATATGPRPQPANGPLHFVAVGFLTVALVVVFYAIVLVLAHF
jgi:putative inorganic carbon (HCO3(-)) transporter